MNGQAEALYQALFRESPMLADGLGLGLTASELKLVKEKLVLAWVAEHIAPGFTAEQWLRWAYGEDAA